VIVGEEEGSSDEIEERTEEEEDGNVGLIAFVVGVKVGVHVPVIVLGMTLITTVSTSTSLDWMINRPVSRNRRPSVISAKGANVVRVVVVQILVEVVM
jgi:hypothetical protein